jgi:hypothetical protein
VGVLEHQVSYLVLHKRMESSMDRKKDEETNQNKSVRATAIMSVLKETIVSFASCFIAFPLETASRRLQVQNPATSGSAVHAASETSNLYAGIAPRLLKTMLVNSILAICYSETNQNFIRYS